VEEKEGAVESAGIVLGDDCAEEEAELEGDIIEPKPELLFDLDGLEYDDCVTNLGCEWDRRSELDEK